MRLDLTCFRNYREARVETDGRIVVLTGPNGSGKTNLLEAISLLAPGRGLRRARLAELDRLDGEPPAPWAVAARLNSANAEIAIGTGRETAGSGDRRVVRIDGATAKSQTVLAQYLNLVWLTPQMDRLFQEGASPRRRFLDRLVFGFDPEHATRLNAYEAALRERMRLLQSGRADPAWLAVLETTIAETGVAVAASRRDVVRRLDATPCAAADMFPTARLGLSGTAESWLADMPALDAEQRLQRELAATRRVDAASGATAIGAHRSDLVVHHGAKNVPATRCSTGEQKALLIAILLSHAQLQSTVNGVTPVVLLDEVTAHLDQPRRAALYERLRALGIQAWLTGTDVRSFAELHDHAHFISVAEGRVSERNNTA